jgi:aminoglycoside phosphotransferase family enzyme/predicted kinase
VICPAQEATAAGGVVGSHASSRLAQALESAAAYAHRPQRVEHLQTHISHVYLTGPVAYKIKKPLALGFLDFSTLEKRREACLEELRINRRLAPELYLDVVPICGTPGHPQVEGAGAPIEYAVKMKQFPAEGMLEQVLARGELSPEMIDEIAQQTAQFHAGLPPADPDGRFGQPPSIIGPALQNFDQLAGLLHSTADLEALARLRAWTQQQHARLGGVFARRLAEGFVRECHGDLHLGNMVLVEGRVRIFDAIEFNAELRWIDLMSEVAFLMMDLLQRAQPALAYRFVNAYLERTGDYAGVSVLRYYLVYRALVRAKVAAIRADQADTPAQQQQALLRKCQAHLRLADTIVQDTHGGIVIHHGVSGSGKTWASQVVLETAGAIRVRSDVERKRMHGLAAGARTGARVEAGIYRIDATAAVYERLLQLARAVVEAGFLVLVDASFLKRAQRDLFRDLAKGLGVGFAIADFHASEDVLRARVAAREELGRDASEAGLEVLDYQLRSQEPLRDDEAHCAVSFATDSMTVTDLRAQACLLKQRVRLATEEHR